MTSIFGSNPETIFHFHSGLLADKARVETYQRAIGAVVKAGDVVLDIGSGTGILSLLACRAGARRVYAVEIGDVAELSKLLCAANHLQDRIVVLNESLYRVKLPEKVDVIVTDTFHSFGLQGGALGLILDARQRLLREGGTIAPRSIELFVVPLELPEAYRRFEIWRRDFHGFDFSPVRDFATNNLYSIALETNAFRNAFLGEPCSLLRIPLAHLDSPNVEGEAVVTASRAGLFHGLGGWFAAELDEGVLLSNSPDIGTVSWKHAFLPLDRPVRIEKGERIHATIHSCDGASWRWQMKTSGGFSSDRASLRGFPYSKESLAIVSPDHAPRLSPEGRAELFLLKLFDGQRTISDMENDIRQVFPGCFESPEAAAAFVRDVARRCS